MLKKIGVIGAGQMGSGIAHVCALAEFNVKLMDVSSEQLEKAREAIVPRAGVEAPDFVADVLPIFEEKCHRCHGPKHQESNFRLDHKPTVFAGSTLGSCIFSS